MFDKKGQSALEYLMTYGWALVVIVIVIAALFAFGIFNPPSAGTCTGLNKLAYVQHSVSGSEFYLRLSNGAGGPISITGVTFASPNLTGISGAAVAGEYPSTTVTSAANIDINSVAGSLSGFTGTGAYEQRITINYTRNSIPASETAICTGNV
ncbi:MAG: hypothetical protein V1847_01655 [Candidatus Diapherotrites archaeon]